MIRYPVPKWMRLIYHLPSILRLFVRLWKDPRVPVYRKAIPVLSGLLGLAVGLAYLAMPLDALPDFLPLPLINRADDFFLLVILMTLPGIWLFIKFAPRSVVAEHIEAIEQSSRRSWGAWP
ncbi:MAG: hypothetical protein KatS3mg115_1113 [Candidatus Poribacteria bacterium]|nr:MAG: hypothetical protein KatS3mg115_1113 [Candidatus Poribacteria bacterium]